MTATGVEPQPRSPWRVVKVAALPGFRFLATFRDGLQGAVEMAKLIHAPDAGVFAALADPVLFEQVEVRLGAPTWPGEIDIAPYAVHDSIASSADRTCRLKADPSAQKASTGILK